MGGLRHNWNLRMNKNKLLANLIAGFHFLWIILILVTLPLLFVFDWFKYIGTSLIIMNILVWFIWRDCPFYIWENELRAKYNKAEVYNEAFVTHYVRKYFNIYIPKIVVKLFLHSYGLLVLIVSLIK